MTALFVGVGNRYRRDDGAGPELAARLRRLHLERVTVADASDDVVRLIDLWEGYDLVVLADAVAGAGEPGTVLCRDALAAPLPRAWFAVSSHQLGPADVVELARTLGRLPPRLVFVGVAGGDFAFGEGLTPPVERGVAHAFSLVREILAQVDR